MRDHCISTIWSDRPGGHTLSREGDTLLKDVDVDYKLIELKLSGRTIV